LNSQFSHLAWIPDRTAAKAGWGYCYQLVADLKKTIGQFRTNSRRGTPVWLLCAVCSSTIPDASSSTPTINNLSVVATSMKLCGCCKAFQFTCGLHPVEVCPANWTPGN